MLGPRDELNYKGYEGKLCFGTSFWLSISFTSEVSSLGYVTLA